MDLQRNSLEYAHVVFSVAPDPADTVEASVDRQSWHPVAIGLDGIGLVLLRGPDNGAADGLPVLEKSELWVRVTGNPEIIVRSAGWIVLYE